jgi:predicted acyltransferase (DUF342 family)
MANSKIPYVTLDTTMNTHRLRFNQLIDSVGDVSSLTTTATSIVGAINEHDAELGTISSAAMGTTASTVSTAIAELDGRLDSINTVELLTPRVWAQDSASLNTFEGQLSVHSAAVLNSTLTAKGNTTVGGTLGVTGNATLAADLAVNGGDITTTSTTANLLNSTATTVNFAGAGTAVNIGAVTGTTKIKNNADIDGTLNVDGTTTTTNINATGLVAVTGDLTVSDSARVENNFSVGGNVDIAGNVNVNGSIVADGQITFKAGANSDIALGDASTDTVTINAEVKSHIIPDANNTYDLGSSSKQWRNLYVDGTGNIDVISADTITTTSNASVGGNLTVTGNGVINGNVDLGNATSDTVSVVGRIDTDLNPSTNKVRDLGDPSLYWKRLFVGGITGDSASFTSDMSVGGSLSVSNDFTVGGNFVITGTQKIASQYIILNDGETGSPTLNAGLSVDRGTADSAVFHWNETGDYWQASYNNAATPSQILTAANVDNSTIEFTSGTINVKNNGIALGTKTTGNYVATIAGTANEIEVSGSGSETAAVTIGLPNDVTIGNNLTVTGNLTVNGTTTTVNTTNVAISDNIMILNNDVTGTPTEDAGIEVERGTSTNAQLLWDESAKYWVAATDTNNTLSRIATANWLDATTPIVYNSTSGNISHATSGVSANTYGQSGTEDGQYIKSITVNATGHITAITADDFDNRYDNYGSWTLSADGGSNQTISSGNTVDIAGGTYITTTASATDRVTITHDNTTRSDGTSAASPNHGGTFTVVDGVTTNATGHVTGINVKTVTLPTDNNTTYSAGEALDLDGTTFSLDLSELTTTTDTSKIDFIPVTDDAQLQYKVAVGNIPLSKFSNDNNWTSNVGTITGVTAGNGLTGGGSSGSVSLNIGAGTGVTVAADAISIGQAVGTTDNVTFNSVTTATIARTGDLTLDASGDIYLDADGGQVVMKDANVATNALTFNLDASPNITAVGAMSMSTNSSFTVDAAGDIVLDADGNEIQFKNGAGGDTVTMSILDTAVTNFAFPGTTNIYNSSGDVSLSASGDLLLDANGGQIILRDGGTTRGYLDVATANQIKVYTGTGTLSTTFSGDDLTTVGTVTAADGNFTNTLTAGSALIIDTWTIVNNSGSLTFSNGGVAKMKLDASGNLTVIGNVTAYGSV